MQSNSANKNRDAVDFANLQLFPMENMDSEASTDITTNYANSICSPQNINIASEITHKQSMSDDEAYKMHTRSYSHSTNNTNDSLVDELTPLKLRNIQSATTYDNSKRRKQRSNSAMIQSKVSRRRKQNSILQKQCRDLESKVKIYQDKITNIQDDFEETEEAIRREFELRLLHLETKYLREKSEKTSLQSQVDKLKLRQELYQRRQVSIGYSSATVTTKSPPVPVFNNNNSYNNNSNQLQFYDTNNIRQRPMMQSYNSNNTVVINSTGSEPNTPNTPNTVNTNNYNSPFAIIDNQNIQKTKKRGNSSASSFSNSSSSNTSSSSSSSSSSTSCSTSNSSYSDSSHSTSTYSSTNTESSQHDTINMVKAKKKYSHFRNNNGKRKYECNYKSLCKKKRKKIPPKYNQRKKKKSKTFWDNLWNLFGPPNLMCATCSDNKSK